MSRARANIQDINVFEVNAENECEAAEQVKSALQDIENVNAEIDDAITMIEGVLGQCEQAETHINRVVDELQQKYDALQAQLDALISSEPTPAEELITEYDYDSEGNVVSSYSYWQETAAHSAWASEVARVESELSAVGAKLNTAKSLQAKIQSKIAELNNTIDTLNNIKNNNENYKEQISDYCQEIIDSSQSASNQLKNALAALELYLAEMVNIVSSPLCASFSWGKMPSRTAESEGSKPGLFTAIKNKFDVYKAEKILHTYVTKELKDILAKDKKSKKLEDSVTFQNEEEFIKCYVKRTGKDPSRALRINGYADSERAYVKKSGPHPDKTALHEHNHLLSANDVKDETGKTVQFRRGISIDGQDTQVNEALTEFFTKKMMGSAYPSHPNVGYLENMYCLEKMEQGFRVETLKEAYYNNRPELLVSRYEAVMGEGKWVEFSKAMEDSLDPWVCSSDRKKAAQKAAALSRLFAIKAKQEENNAK